MVTVNIKAPRISDANRSHHPNTTQIPHATKTIPTIMDISPGIGIQEDISFCNNSSLKICSPPRAKNMRLENIRKMRSAVSLLILAFLSHVFAPGSDL